MSRIWTVVPTQVAAWGAWRLGSRFELGRLELDYVRLAVFVLMGLMFLLLGIRGKLPRSKRFYLGERPSPRDASRIRLRLRAITVL